MIRRALDAGLAALGLLVVSPVLAAAAALVHWQSPGPALFHHRRVGLGGREFEMLKLRTMTAGSERGHPVTGPGDPRITPAGRFLRKWKIDELPQFLNVLRGEMALVGPRPEVPRFVAAYTEEQRKVLSVRPGITGPTQIRWRNEEDCFPPGVDTEAYYLAEILPRKLVSDLKYLRSRSLPRDLGYLWQTLLAVLGIERRRRLLIALADVLVTVGAYLGAHLIRFDGEIPVRDLGFIRRALPVLILIRLAAFAGFGLYRGVWTYASIRDLVAVIKAVTMGSAAFAVALVFLGVQGHSRAVLVVDWLLAVLLVGGVRLWIRLLRGGLQWRPAGSRPVLIIGAGAAGAGVARDLLENARAGRHPEGFLDDDPDRRGMRIHGVPVLGTIDDVGPVARTREIEEVIIAIPSADRRAMRRIVDRCREAAVRMRIVPGLEALLSGRTRVSEIREVQLEDLLRREPVRLDPSTIREALRGRRVLVTGAGGSIGSEICRQVAAAEPALLVLLDRHEGGLFEIEAELAEAHPALPRASALVDIKHTHKLVEVFGRHRPEVVFDAAAYKHVPFMEAHPDEAVLNNVVGTRQLVETALAHGVGTFLLISTDKAVNPSSVMGATKRVAERYLQAVAEHPGARESVLCAVRFGNVLGSSGSVVPVFRKQIERGGPITVTHPDMTRYFMTIPEAVQLVLRASTLARGGEIFVLEMGEPVRIVEMARDLVRLSGLEAGRDIEIAYTGLRPGEKLTEELWTGTEDLEPTVQEKLLVIRQPEAEAASLQRLLGQIETLERLAKAGDVERLIPALRRVVPEYEPIALGPGGNGHALRAARAARVAGGDGAGGVAVGGAAGSGSPVRLVRRAGATDGAAAGEQAGHGAHDVNGSAARWPGCPGSTLPGSRSPATGESRPTAP